jgi:hypothetical protein
MRRPFTNFVKNGNRVGENRKQVRVSVVRKIENTPEGLSPPISPPKFLRLLQSTMLHFERARNIL